MVEVGPGRGAPPVRGRDELLQVAAELGCAKSYLTLRFREARLQSRPSGRPLTTPAPVVNPTDIVRLREAGHCYPQIAAELGLSRDIVRDRYLAATGLPRRTAVRRPRPATPDV